MNRWQGSVDRWLSIHGVSDEAAAFAVDSLEVHILVDLNGHSKGARPGVLLRRPAPILISYLGYPSTTGGLDDVVLTDAVALRPEAASLFTERLAYVPHSYFVTDHRQLYPRPFEGHYDRGPAAAPAAAAGRAAHALPPPHTPVIGNFGQLYKVEPRLFDAWARILKRLSAAAAGPGTDGGGGRGGGCSVQGGANCTGEGAVLWLLQFPPEATSRLRAQADARRLPSAQVRPSLSPLVAAPSSPLVPPTSPLVSDCPLALATRYAPSSQAHDGRRRSSAQRAQTVPSSARHAQTVSFVALPPKVEERGPPVHQGLPVYAQGLPVCPGASGSRSVLPVCSRSCARRSRSAQGASSLPGCP